MNFNKSISKLTQSVMIIIKTMMMCFVLSWQDIGIVSIISSNNYRNKVRKNNIRITGTLWELKKTNTANERENHHKY